MTEAGESLFEAVRDACFPATWSRGVELTKADAVVGETHEGDEAIFRITTRGGMICPRVTLFTDDIDWDCECSSREPACEHVAAAVIAWRQSVRTGKGFPAPRLAAGRVGYRFGRSEGGLTLERVIVQEDRSEFLESTLVALAEGRVDGPRILATQPDLAAEVALGTHRRGTLPARGMIKLFRSLARCQDLQLDGRPIEVSDDPVLPRVRVEDQGDGFRLSLVQDPSVTETFRNAVALCDGTLRPVGESRLTGRELHDLPGGRHFSAERVAELVTEVLPSLKRRLPVDILTSRLPETTVERPRIHLDITRRDRTLSVLATLVYGDPPAARIDGGRLVHLQGIVPLRNEKAERGELRRLRELGLGPGVRAEFTGVEAVAFRARLKRWERAADPEQGSPRDARGGGDELGFFDMAPPLVPHLQIEGDELDLYFESPEAEGHSGGTRRAAADEVMRAWIEGVPLVPLMGGGWAALPVDWLQRLGHRVQDLLAARDVEGKVPRCCLADLAELCEELDRPAPPGFERLRGLFTGFEAIPGAELPADLTATLRSYQQEGLDWLVFLRDAGLGALLADDMGLGKTLQALCTVRSRVLVVAPTSVLHNWADEIRMHRPGLSASIYHGPGRTLDREADVTLTTYAILRLDADRLAAETWDTVILDEAQNIKNPDSQVAGAAFRLKADFRVALTGTPVENRLDELWSQFHFLNRGLLGGRRDFREHYADPIASGEPDVAGRLRRRIRPFILRRLKRDVATELPPRTEMELHCELSDREREVYDAIRAATLSQVVQRLDQGGSVLAALEALLRLRQAACHTGLVPGHEAEGSSKLAVLLEALENVIADGHRALIFSQWTSLLDLTEPHLQQGGIDYLRLDGSTRDRKGVVDRFQSDDGPPILLISLKAGGTGLNLTKADHIFLLDPWWNPAVEDQAADRAHRIGQERPVMVYRLVASDTVEERILALQARKREVAEAVLGGADQAGGLTRSDLVDLLR